MVKRRKMTVADARRAFRHMGLADEMHILDARLDPANPFYALVTSIALRRLSDTPRKARLLSILLPESGQQAG